MAITVGPTSWWLRSKEATNYYARACPEGTILPDGSAIFCKAGGVAWIVAPSCTQVSSQWAGGQYNGILVGDKCCICEWSTLCTCLITCGFNPCDWFVPCHAVLFNSWNCCTKWNVTSWPLFSSSELSTTTSGIVDHAGNCGPGNKTSTYYVRAFRCLVI